MKKLLKKMEMKLPNYKWEKLKLLKYFLLKNLKKEYRTIKIWMKK